MTTPLSQSQLSLKFWGVRGSYPVPGSATLRYGGNTPSIEITARNENHTFTLIVDAGTGIIGLGRELAQRAGRQVAAPSKPPCSSPTSTTTTRRASPSSPR